MDGKEWIARFAETLGVDPPSPEAVDTLLALAGVAAHASERIAAPIACYLAALSSTDPGVALTLAREVAPGGPDANGGDT